LLSSPSHDPLNSHPIQLQTIHLDIPSMPDINSSEITADSLPSILENDTKVKIAGVDVDGILRGKLMSKKKFLGIIKDGFGFCSVVFGWDMHDMTYFKELEISNAANGYRDLIAIPDLSSFRRIPWEDDVPFFLVSFFDPDTMEPVSACPRGLLKTAMDKVQKAGYGAMAGGMDGVSVALLELY
jgi:glutamine synthetase